MNSAVLVILLVIILLLLAAGSVRVVTEYERGVRFRLGKVRETPFPPGLMLKFPIIDRLVKVSLRIVTLPIQSQGIITRDNVSVDISAVAYYRVVDPIKSVVAIEDVESAIGQIAQTTLRNVVGQHTLDETLTETNKINADIAVILDGITEVWGVEVTLVELKDIQLPETMKRAMAREAEAETERESLKAEAARRESEALASAGEIEAERLQEIASLKESVEKAQAQLAEAGERESEARHRRRQ